MFIIVLNKIKKGLFQKLISCCISILIIIAFTLQISVISYGYTGNGSIIVHVTRTGACYHKAGCGALKSDIEMTLEDAYIAGYLPCDRCNPPIYTGDAKRETIKEKSSNSGTNTKSIKVNTGNTSDNTRNTKASNTNYLKWYFFLPIIVAFMTFIIARKIKRR